MFNKILDWIRGDRLVETGFQLEIAMVTPDAREIRPPMDKTPAPSQPEPLCPHCGYRFTGVPTSKKECPDCKKEVVVRSSNKIKTLMKAEEASQFDTAKKETAGKKKLVGYLHMAHIQFKSLDDVKERLEKETGTKLSDEDTVWKVLNAAVVDGLAAQNYRGLQHINFAMAHFERDHGRDCFESVREMHRMQLMEYLSEGYGRDGYNWKVKVSAPCKCPYCNEIKKRTFEIEEALAKMLFPSRKCEVWTSGAFPFLGRYRVHVEEDER